MLPNGSFNAEDYGEFASITVRCAAVCFCPRRQHKRVGERRGSGLIKDLPEVPAVIAGDNRRDAQFIVKVVP